MEPEVRFARIEALLNAMAERENQRETHFNRRVDRADQLHQQAIQRMDRADQLHKQAIERMDRADRKWEKRHSETMQRMEVFDRRLEATRKLVEAGIKMVAGMRQRNKETEEIVRDLAKTQKAFLDSLKRGRTGSGHNN